jgi:hypothetical protein
MFISTENIIIKNQTLIGVKKINMTVLKSFNNSEKQKTFVFMYENLLLK